jgi:hypothetical protein
MSTIQNPTRPSQRGAFSSELRQRRINVPTKPRKFGEIIGSRLLSIGETTQATLDLACVQSPRVVNLPVLEFDQGTLIIENPFTLTTSNGDFVSADPIILVELEKLIGCSVVDASFEVGSIIVKFERDVVLTISCRDEDYSSPEAGSFAPNNGPTIVFD